MISNKLFLQPVLIVMLSVPLLLASTLVIADTGEETGPERVQVTDPDELESFGYPRDATNISKLVHDQPLADRSNLSAEELESSPRGSLTRYTTYSGFEFVPLTHTIEYLKGPSFLMQNGALASSQATPVTFEVQLQIPHGSSWDFLDIFGFHDAAGRELRFTVLSRCAGAFLEAANPVETVLRSITVTDQGANFVRSPSLSGLVLDNRLCTYHVRTVFWTDTTAPGVLMQLIKVRAEYAIPASMAPLIFQDRFEGS